MLVYILFKLFTGVNCVFVLMKTKKKRLLDEALLFPGNAIDLQLLLD